MKQGNLSLHLLRFIFLPPVCNICKKTLYKKYYSLSGAGQMNSAILRDILFLSFFIILEFLTSFLGWNYRSRLSKILLGMAIFQTLLPLTLFILGVIFPAAPSGSPLNFGVFFGILITIVPIVEILLIGISFIIMLIILVTILRNPRHYETSSSTVHPRP